MPFISHACLEQIRQRVSIVDVVSPYVQLKPAGHAFKGLSPFSNEKTPSFFVDPQKNVFKCFSSGYAGDMFRFLELKEQLSFGEAVEWIAERFNVPLEYERDGGRLVENVARSNKKVLWDIYSKAEQFFKKCFWISDNYSVQVRDYWEKSRGFSKESAQTFSIGFAPLERFELYKCLRRDGYDHAVLQQSGLFYASKNAAQSNLACRYQSRLILPIKDIQGRTIAFSGRCLPFVENSEDPTRDAKYVNSPETPIFVKGHQLFNLHQARQNFDGMKPFFLVEGPLDVVRCWECGLKTAIAPQGTGLTEMQLKLLQRYSSFIVGMFDGDGAGVKAGLRLMDLGLPLGLQLQYVLLDLDKDPDSWFALQKSACTYESLLEKSLMPIPFIMQAFRRLEANEKRAERLAMDFIYSILTKCPSAIVKYESLRTLSGETGMPLKVLEEDFRRLDAKHAVQYTINDEQMIANVGSYWDSAEGQLLGFLFHKSACTACILEVLFLDWIDTTVPVGQLLFKIVHMFITDGIEPLTMTTMEALHLSESERELWYQIAAEPFQIEDERKMLVTILQQLYKKFLKKCISNIDKEMTKSSIINADKVEQLRVERYRLKKALVNVHLEVRWSEQ
ncbi:MAG: DNA primase [Puniceicoccales bacterium]|jgi:DNA primase|nr:DNA primase [Puniceicoccales bacterium]